MFNKKLVTDINVQGKRVLVRVDFNVPIQDGVVTDDTRIRAALPTIRYLLEQRAAVILCSHLGRPKSGPEPTFSMKPTADRLAQLIDYPVSFAEDCIGPSAELAARELRPEEVLVLENTRFHSGEKTNDPEMASQLATLADIYVNDAFGSAHRAHASTEGVTRHLPSVGGFLMEKEIRYLGNAISDPKKPFIAILGGAKVSDKIDVIHNLLDKADAVLVGGGMANTFFKAQGYPVGDSLVEDEVLDNARGILQSAGTRLRLPVDVVVADSFSDDADRKIMDMGPIPEGWRILDIGPETITSYANVINEAAMVVWNGPMGVFEFPNFAVGTFRIAEILSASDAISIIGGGDSIAAINRSGLSDKVTHLSTGGGASLEMLEGKILPGLAALDEK